MELPGSAGNNAHDRIGVKLDAIRLDAQSPDRELPVLRRRLEAATHRASRPRAETPRQRHDHLSPVRLASQAPLAVALRGKRLDSRGAEPSHHRSVAPLSRARPRSIWKTG